MQRNVDNVEIKEPPLQELQKNRSCLRRSCFTGCLFLILLVVTFLIIVKFAATPRVRQLKEIPALVPESIPIYDKDNIDSITYISAKERTKTIELAAFLPKAILVPLYVGTEEYLPEDIREVFGTADDQTGWKRYIQLIKEPLFPTSDLIEIKWTQLSANPDFLKEFYEKELQKNGFIVIEIVSDTAIEEIRFMDQEEKISGTFSTEDTDKTKRGTNTAILQIQIEVTDS